LFGLGRAFVLNPKVASRFEVAGRWIVELVENGSEATKIRKGKLLERERKKVRELERPGALGFYD
jgi:hypothetical protein